MNINNESGKLLTYKASQITLKYNTANQKMSLSLKIKLSRFALCTMKQFICICKQFSQNSQFFSKNIKTLDGSPAILHFKVNFAANFN